MSDPTPTPDAVPRALATTRLIWAAMLMGQLTFFAVVLVLSNSNKTPAVSPQTADLIFYIAMGSLLTLVPAGYFIRNQIYKKNWQAHAVAPTGYLNGNIILIACLEAVCILGLIAVFLSKSFWPAVLPAAIAVALHAINFPTGLPMKSVQPTTGMPLDD